MTPALRTFFIARRMAGGRSGNTQGKNNSLYGISVTAVALSVGVMIISMAVLNGFQHEIKSKVNGFVSDIQVVYYDHNQSLEPTPFNASRQMTQLIAGVPGVKHVQPFATKAGIIRKGDDMEGAILKGVDHSYNWSFYHKLLVSGQMLRFGDKPHLDILISKKLAEKLNYKTGDNLIMYFAQQPPLVRKFSISGIYHTGLEDFDEKFIWCDIRQVRKLNKWSPEQVGGLEIMKNKDWPTDKVVEEVNAVLPVELEARDIREQYPQLFDWLKLQDINVQVILILMTLVAIVNVITALIILIMEKVKMIGILKALGADNPFIRKVFIYRALLLVAKGLLIGNSAALLLCFLQYRFKLVKLDEASYYMKQVPVLVNANDVLYINLATIIICFTAMIIPSSLIAKISPVRAIRFA